MMHAYVKLLIILHDFWRKSSDVVQEMLLDERFITEIVLSKNVLEDLEMFSVER